MFKKLLLGASLLGLFSVSAGAADVELTTNPFNGFYVGVHGGYGWADSEVDYDGDFVILDGAGAVGHATRQPKHAGTGEA